MRSGPKRYVDTLSSTHSRVHILPNGIGVATKCVSSYVQALQALTLSNSISTSRLQTVGSRFSEAGCLLMCPLVLLQIATWLGMLATPALPTQLPSQLLWVSHDAVCTCHATKQLSITKFASFTGTDPLHMGSVSKTSPATSYHG